LQSSDVAPNKDEFLLKIYAGYLIPEEAIAQQIKDHRQLHQQQLETYQAIERNFFSSPQNCQKEYRFAYLTLRRGINFEQGWIDWCDEALDYSAPQCQDRKSLKLRYKSSCSFEKNRLIHLFPK